MSFNPNAPSLNKVLSTLGLRRRNRTVIDSTGHVLLEKPEDRVFVVFVWDWLRAEYLPSLGVTRPQTDAWFGQGVLPEVLR